MKTDPIAAIADRLHEARQSRGLLQQEVARKLDVGLSTVQGWERGNWLPSLKYARRIAKHFPEIPYEDLVNARIAADEVELQTEEGSA